MLRLKSEIGWWLITHRDHAHLAGAFAQHWGNATFRTPTPREHVLHAIHVHDDGWARRDADPSLTREGIPAAFSSNLVGKYSAFEEIDLADYLAVRERAVSELEQHDPYAALLVCLHTYNLLTDRADRSTIRTEQLPLLDEFLDRQRQRQDRLRTAIRTNPAFSSTDTGDERLLDNFRLLQACDNLSLLSCVAYDRPATLLHPLRTKDGAAVPIDVVALEPRTFRLVPYPFDTPEFTVDLPARHIEGDTFLSTENLRVSFATAPITELTITITA